MQEKHIISVIVPIYKVEKYIYRCVDSILRQTYHNLEIILVDDGSPDGCPLICDEYARQDEPGNEHKTKYLRKLEKVFNLKGVLAQSCEHGGKVFVVASNKLYKSELWTGYRYPEGRLHEDELAGTSNTICNLWQPICFRYGIWQCAIIGVRGKVN